MTYQARALNDITLLTVTAETIDELKQNIKDLDELIV
jgi:hypothetical protein